MALDSISSSELVLADDELGCVDGAVVADDDDDGAFGVVGGKGNSPRRLWWPLLL